MDKIKIKGIKAFGRHGVMVEEKTLGQPFIVDIVLYLDLSIAGKSDNLEHTVNYAEIFNIVTEQISRQNYNLIESLAYSMIKQCFLYDQRIAEIKIKVKKPQAPLSGEFKWAEVEMRRKRNECLLS